MSSAGRGERGGGGDDFFVTPAWCVHRLLEAVALPGGAWLEPAAGNGSIIRAVNAVRGDVAWRGMEIRDEERAALSELCPVEIGDYLAPVLSHVPASVVLSNPPYGLAMEFIASTLGRFPNAWKTFLLRLNFAGSDGRAAFMHRWPPDVYVLPNRPSFTPDGLTDSIEYAWFVWPPGIEQREAGAFRVLATTPLVDRRRVASFGTVPARKRSKQ